MPSYYAQIVDEEQRAKIYAIQAKFEDQLAPLRKQIAELEAQRKSEIDAMLTPEQHQKLKQLIDAAKSKRSSDAPPAAKPEAKATAKPEAAN